MEKGRPADQKRGGAVPFTFLQGPFLMTKLRSKLLETIIKNDLQKQTSSYGHHLPTLLPPWLEEGDRVPGQMGMP